MAYPIPTPAELGNHQATRRVQDAALTHGDKSNIQKIRARPEKVSFWDFVDIINPLQHIPVVSTIYRGLTGDAIAPAARIAGGALFGGFIGAALGTANAIAEMKTDRDIGENVMKKLDVNLADKGLQKKEAHEAIPVVEVRPVASARPQAPVIFWDDEMPVVMAATSKEKIIWDDPAAPQATRMASITPQAGTETLRQKNNEMVFASAMPAQKSLSELDGGTPRETSVKEKDAKSFVPAEGFLPPEKPVAQAMEEALQKYAAMQGGTAQPTVPASSSREPDDTGEIFIPAVNTASRHTISAATQAVPAREAFQGFRRYR